MTERHIMDTDTSWSVLLPDVGGFDINYYPMEGWCMIRHNGRFLCKYGGLPAGIEVIEAEHKEKIRSFLDGFEVGLQQGREDVAKPIIDALKLGGLTVERLTK